MPAARKPFRTCLGVGLAAVAASAALAALPAAAQPYPDDAYGAPVGGVTVYAPQRYAYDPQTGRRVRLDSISMVVPLGDLDLSTRYGAIEARRRIEDVARHVCEEARDVYLNDGDPPGGCYATAVRHAVAQAEAVAGYPILAWR